MKKHALLAAFLGISATFSLLLPTLGQAEAVRGDNPPPSAVRTYFFECDDGSSYVLRTRPDEAWIFLAGDARRLSPFPAEKGTKYGGGGFEIHIQGENAQIVETGKSPRQCRNNGRKAVWERAKLDGADFRAVGNEPGWELLIIDGRIILDTDYGTTRIEVPLPTPSTDRKKRTTVWKTEGLTLQITGKRCADTMADEAYESTVTVILPGGQTLQGCGKALH